MAPREIEPFVPAITPFAAGLSLDTCRFFAHARALLAGGAHGLAPLGTTGEANSLTLAARMTGLEALIDAGVAASQLVPGTGYCALEDTVALSRHATGLGCRGVQNVDEAAARARPPVKRINGTHTDVVSEVLAIASPQTGP